MRPVIREDIHQRFQRVLERALAKPLLPTLPSAPAARGSRSPWRKRKVARPVSPDVDPENDMADWD
ncbi:MAG: hypothetical protein HY403_01795 [Elusimicrobia bacterium]|nr:hypothetical protein [Elusimicrobiota bacterium]